jgi:hypothetical protein
VCADLIPPGSDTGVFSRNCKGTRTCGPKVEHSRAGAGFISLLGPQLHDPAYRDGCVRGPGVVSPRRETSASAAGLYQAVR